ncbi:MAG: ABC transporter ATP-binding protein [Firmicutes bacterium]|nr:ABC transporter ATP-binding protein [Bacillota bacterium]
MSAILQAEGIVKRFGRFVALDGVSLSVEEGRITALIGPNGAGKTSFINVLSGRLAPDGGRVIFQGCDVTRVEPAARVRMGLTRSFQIMTLFPELTVEENVLLPVLARRGAAGRWFRPYKADAEAREEAADVLRRIGLWEERHVPAGLVSHGDQRLLELGIAVATKPSLCLLDEPTSGMNPEERKAVLELIRSLSASRSTTFVIVEHDMDVVFSLAEHVFVLHRGKVLAEGTPDDIRQNPAVRDVYLGEELDECWR